MLPLTRSVPPAPSGGFASIAPLFRNKSLTQSVPATPLVESKLESTPAVAEAPVIPAAAPFAEAAHHEVPHPQPPPLRHTGATTPPPSTPAPAVEEAAAPAATADPTPTPAAIPHALPVLTQSQAHAHATTPVSPAEHVQPAPIVSTPAPGILRRQAPTLSSPRRPLSAAVRPIFPNKQGSTVVVPTSTMAPSPPLPPLLRSQSVRSPLTSSQISGLSPAPATPEETAAPAPEPAAEPTAASMGIKPPPPPVLTSRRPVALPIALPTNSSIAEAIPMPDNPGADFFPKPLPWELKADSTIVNPTTPPAPAAPVAPAPAPAPVSTPPPAPAVLQRAPGTPPPVPVLKSGTNAPAAFLSRAGATSGRITGVPPAPPAPPAPAAASAPAATETSEVPPAESTTPPKPKGLFASLPWVK